MNYFVKFKIARLNRSQHFILQLIVFFTVAIVCFSAALLCHFLGITLNKGVTGKLIYNLGILVAIFWMIISMIMHIARLHDCNRSGWWILPIYFLSGIFVLPIFLLYVWPGDKSVNIYGKLSNKLINLEFLTKPVNTNNQIFP